MNEAPGITLAMTPAEGLMLRRHLQPGVRYLEFGAGGSTLLALEQGVAHCTSVESDASWVDRLRTEVSVRQAEAAGRIAFHPVDIGPVLAWGMPADTSRIAAWPQYFLAPWAALATPPDVILIDGRFRVACALAALLAMPPGTAILMHDFFDPLPIRKNYSSLLDVAAIVAQEGNMVRLERNTDTQDGALLARMAVAWTDFA